MRYSSLAEFLSACPRGLAPGPVALVFAEDEVALDDTLRYHQTIGFRAIVVFLPAALHIARDLEAEVVQVRHDVRRGTPVHDVVTRAAARLGGRWLYYCHNAEFLFFPFSESRSVGELLAFHADERRSAMLSYVIDLYADDLDRCPDGYSMDRAHLDKAGYFAQARHVPNGPPKERQLDFFGGLRWRFEEHVPFQKRKIDRISLFRAIPRLELRPDFTFSEEEYNTYACPWHHNLTAAICSFRTAKALRRNPGSKYAIDSFMWRNSVPFSWSSRQLLELGLMEPGQWF